MIAVLQLRWQLAWAVVLLWVAGAGRTGEAKPEVHLYLADLHYRLADAYRSAGRLQAAAREERLANKHAENGPPPEPRPAAAMAMGVPQPPTFTDARGKRFDPDDVA